MQWEKPALDAVYTNSEKEFPRVGPEILCID